LLRCDGNGCAEQRRRTHSCPDVFSHAASKPAATCNHETILAESKARAFEGLWNSSLGPIENSRGSPAVPSICHAGLVGRCADLVVFGRKTAPATSTSNRFQLEWRCIVNVQTAQSLHHSNNAGSSGGPCSSRSC
jgi:hypothetical protein